jgi:hypothetical protein
MRLLRFSTFPTLEIQNDECREGMSNKRNTPLLHSSFFESRKSGYRAHMSRFWRPVPYLSATFLLGSSDSRDLLNGVGR